MSLLAGYQLEATLHDGARSTLLRARRLRDDCPVILKVPKSDYLDRRRVLELRREYAIMRMLPAEHVVRALGVEEFPDRVVLILEDFGGMSLKHVLVEHRKLAAAEFLGYALKLAVALDEIHRRNIIHKDIKPHNVIVNTASGLLKLADFSSASSIAHEDGAASSSPDTSGTLAYMAPEQTGRMSLGIDYRADYYALGATFYEMLVGSRPFTTQDPLELVHAHLAKTPPAPHEVEPAVPRALSQLVMKLLAKSPEDRYQSARGLMADLEECQRRLRDNGILESFELGRVDRQRAFHLPQRVYGRSSQVASLLDAYEGIVTGKRALVLVTGWAGVGKTSVINELNPHILASRGRFIGGKCDQLIRGTPFAPFVQAIAALIQQLLAERAEAGEWARRIHESLGANVAVLAEAVPEVQHLLGAQPAPTPLLTTESRNRLHFVLQRFLQVFAGAGRPLVLFLDDLQWADSATLSFLQGLALSEEFGHLLLVGTYRDHEVSAGHPLSIMLGELEAAHAPVQRIHLPALEPDDVAAMLCESLGTDLETTRPLARLVQAKTSGNPLFIKEFLRFLHANHLLTFDERSLAWSWELARIEDHPLPDNVAELMTGGIRALPAETMNALRVAACLGGQFDFHSLVVALAQPAKAVAAALWTAVERGLVVPLHPDYRLLDPVLKQALPQELNALFRFLHDRVRQAAYSLLPEPERAATHVDIGLRLFHDARTAGRLDESLFAILSHLDFAPGRVQGEALRLQLANLHLTAGRQAKASGAYRSACELFQGGIAFLAANAWEQERPLTFAVHLELAECYSLVGEREEAAAGFMDLLQRARGKVEQASIYAIRANLACDSGQHAMGIRIGLEGLRIFGIQITETPNSAAVGAALATFTQQLGNRAPKDLLELPTVQDPEAQSAVVLLSVILSSSYQTNPNLLALLVLQLLSLSLEHGNSPLSAFGYATYGIILCTALDNPEVGYEFGQLAIALAERFKSPLLHARTRYVSAAFISHWTRSFHLGLAELTEAYKSMLENGERTHAYHCISLRQHQRLSAGAPLQELCAEDEKFLDLLANKDPGTYLGLLEKYRFVLALMGKEVPEFSDLGNESSTIRTGFDITRAEWSYTFGDYEKALAHAEAAASSIHFLAGQDQMVRHTFIHALAMTACYASTDSERRRQFRDTLAVYEALMRKRASRCAENYGQQALLVSAEIARIDGRNAEAQELYDQAIEAARGGRFLSEEARANELAFRFHLVLGRRTIADAYLIETLYAYERWGATGKVNELARTHAQRLLPWRLRATGPRPGALVSDGGAAPHGKSENAGDFASEALDLATVVKASQAISSEIKLTHLLDKLIRIAIENVGAQRGLLVLRRGEDFFVEVEGGEVSQQEPILLSESTRLCQAVAYSVLRTNAPVLLDDAFSQGAFTSDPYICENRLRSLLCAPIVHQGRITGLFYLENNRTAGAFTAARLDVLRMLSGQTAISIENARLYERLEEYSRTLENRVAERTVALNTANVDLRHALDSMKAMQERIVLQEKLASLGTLTAGIAHEIRNPLNFVTNFAELAHIAAGELRDALQGQPLSAEARQEADTLLADIATWSQIVCKHGERANQIVNKMEKHSRGSSGSRQEANVNLLVREALEIVQHDSNDKQKGLKVEVETSFDPAHPQVSVVPEDISRVLINLLNNAFFAARQRGTEKGASRQPWVWVTTQDLEDRVEIRIRDNGSGISKAVLSKLFTPFFTTKPPGEGTGLGLSISHDIVVKGHGGELRVQSEEGQYAEFVVLLPKVPAA
ncbi:trifunctional serine/threonine-protein kinase/ATP-binding protein/sensor histidine kinase [Stigmatella erecta]|uniref:histidine kinase n=1 Tax=Stigmatella erecta TaxID=83460 RepID=A0A1H9YRR2_9BACT|nr:ATP-binding sensor histidine kinase [Stigmatella erecta]SES71222.1 Predicted ATPase [Stigmatella erecta]